MLLSICVPTYNRAALLGEALAAIAGQLDATTTGLVQIIVSDNASNDDTAAVVRALTASRPDIHLIYHRQERNLGAERNIYTLTQLATTPWMFLLSDDDLLLPGAIHEILARIQADPRLAGVCLNSRSFTGSPDEVTPVNLPTTQDCVFTAKDDALRFLGTFITFLSVMAFRRELVADRDYACRVGTNFIHSYIFLDVLAQGGALAVADRPYLAIRSNNTGGYNFFQTFVTSFAELMKYAEAVGFSSTATRAVLAAHRQFILNFVKLFKVRGAFGSLTPDYRDGTRRILTVYGSDPVFLLKTIPLMLLPEAVFWPLYRLLRRPGARPLSKRTRAGA